MPIAIPNTHALRDPRFAEAEATKHFSPWLTVGDSIVQYGADLLLRALQSAPREVPDLVLVGSVFRQAVVAADGCLVCLKAAAVQGALLHSRAEFEAGLSLEWILSKGKDRWARQFYVASLRQMRSWALQTVPGTYEEQARAAAWGSVPLPAFSADQIANAAKDVTEIDALLNTPTYKSINDDFEQKAWIGKGKKRRRREPHWYQPGIGGVESIGAMARGLGREAEYVSLYRYMSYFAHGSLTDNHFKVAEGRAAIEPIRYLKQFATAFNGTFLDVVRTYQWITREYRPDEMDGFGRKYRDEWLPQLTTFADVTVEPEIINL